MPLPLSDVTLAVRVGQSIRRPRHSYNGPPRTRRASWRASSSARVRELVHLYAERGSAKYEKAAMRWLERYLAESLPGLQHFAEVAGDLAKLEPLDR